MLAQALKALRTAKGLSQREWARRSGIDPPLASMAYQISGQARLSAAHGTEHASTPAGQADRGRQ